MPQEELNLIEFAAGQMTESRAGAPKIVRRQLVDVGAARGCSDDIPEHLGRHSIAPHASGFVDRAEQDTVRDTRSDRPCIDRVLYPCWNRHSPDMLGLANQVSDHPVIFPQLN